MQRMTGNALLVIGTVLLGISILADTLGIGNGTVFGHRQFTGVFVGIFLASVGLWIFRRAD